MLDSLVKIILLDKTCKGHKPLLNTDLIFFAIFQKSIGSCPTKWRHHFYSCTNKVNLQLTTWWRCCLCQICY